MLMGSEHSPALRGAVRSKGIVPGDSHSEAHPGPKRRAGLQLDRCCPYQEAAAGDPQRCLCDVASPGGSYLFLPERMGQEMLNCQRRGLLTQPQVHVTQLHPSVLKSGLGIHTFSHHQVTIMALYPPYPSFSHQDLAKHKDPCSPTRLERGENAARLSNLATDVT